MTIIVSILPLTVLEFKEVPPAGILIQFEYLQIGRDKIPLKTINSVKFKEDEP